jgi:PLD-like domain
VRVRFVSQPFQGGTDLRDFLQAAAALPDRTALCMVVAWAKRSGLARATDELNTIRGRGGTVAAIVGVSEGGATEQGLRMLIEHTDEAYVFHDRRRTFHPKVYLAESGDHAMLLVGSHNLTAGGLAWNYEAGLWVDLNLTLDADRTIRDDAVGYFDQLRSDTDVCKRLDTTSLQAMLADGSLFIQDEDARSRPGGAAQPDEPEDTDSTQRTPDGLPVSVFGNSQLPKRPAPTGPARQPHRRPPRNPAPVTGAVAGSRPRSTAVKRWFKRLDNSDAQHPPAASSNPTGNLRLSQERLPLDHKTYFRSVFFGGLDWAPVAGRPGMVDLWLPFQTVVVGDYLGAVMLRISHWPKRIEDQGNVPTILHWGDLGARMRANNYVGDYLTLERAADGTFALTVAPQPLGGFLY